MLLSVRLSKNNENLLKNLIAITGETKSYCVNKALEEYLEDQLDYFEAERVSREMKELEDKGEKAYCSLDELISERGYDL